MDDVFQLISCNFYLKNNQKLRWDMSNVVELTFSFVISLVLNSSSGSWLNFSAGGLFLKVNFPLTVTWLGHWLSPPQVNKWYSISLKYYILCYMFKSILMYFWFSYSPNSFVVQFSGQFRNQRFYQFVVELLVLWSTFNYNNNVSSLGRQFNTELVSHSVGFVAVDTFDCNKSFF